MFDFFDLVARPEEQYDAVPDYRELRRGLVKSRKEHKCEGGHTIPAGTVYERHVYVEDGVFGTVAVCIDCIRRNYE